MLSVILGLGKYRIREVTNADMGRLDVLMSRFGESPEEIPEEVWRAAIALLLQNLFIRPILG